MSRIDKVNQLIKREISNIIQLEVEDPRLQMVTITQVDVSRDLRQARVRFSVLGDSKNADATLEGLNNARGYIRKLVGQRIRMRHVPEMDFFYDKSIEYSAQVEQTLRKIHDENNIDH